MSEDKQLSVIVRRVRMPKHRRFFQAEDPYGNVHAFALGPDDQHLKHRDRMSFTWDETNRELQRRT